MHSINYNIDLFALFILLGIGQGIFISAVLLFKKKNRNKANIFLSLFLLAITLTLIDMFLWSTRLIVNVIYLYNFSGPLLFTMGPLIYLYFKQLINKNKAKYLPHFILFILFLAYDILYFIQSNEVKYTIFIHWNVPEVLLTNTIDRNLYDPLHIKRYYIHAFIAHLFIYLTLSLASLIKYFRSHKYKFFICENEQTRWIRDLLLMCFTSALITTIIRFTVYRGTYDNILATYLSLFVYFISFRLALNPGIININLSWSVGKKYNKSSLSNEMKQELLIRIKKSMEEEKLYRSSLLTLSKLSAKVSASPNHISQVINECLNQNFYEMLAYYRIMDAKVLLDKPTKYTLDEIAYRVGYNSRTAFNNAFKKNIGKTPSEYINSLK